MEDKIRKIGSRQVYNGIRVNIFKEQILMPSGKIAEWELIKHPGAAAVIPVDEDGRIIMARQYRNASDNYTLEIPAGCLDSPDEEPIHCARRELEEETGYSSRNLEYLFNFYSAIGICDEVIHIFVAKDLIKSQQNLDEDEYVTLERYTINELIEMIFRGEILDNKTISSLLMYKEKYLNN